VCVCVCLGEVTLEVRAEALHTEQLCGNEVAPPPTVGRVDTVVRKLLVEVRFTLMDGTHTRCPPRTLPHTGPHMCKRKANISLSPNMLSLCVNPKSSIFCVNHEGLETLKLNLDDKFPHRKQ
jgi:hypothetical protein